MRRSPMTFSVVSCTAHRTPPTPFGADANGSGLYDHVKYDSPTKPWRLMSRRTSSFQVAGPPSWIDVIWGPIASQISAQQLLRSLAERRRDAFAR